MISAVITSFKEPKTIGRAIEAILANKIPQPYEILVVAPDEETLSAAAVYTKKHKNIKTVKDEGKGKPAALNLILSKAKGEIIIFTDGDVHISNDSLKYLLEPFKEKEIGAVSGNPVSADSKDNRMGFWAYMLTDVAHQWRLASAQKHQHFFCTGYLFAIRKNLFPKLPEELLSEDGYISQAVYSKKQRIAYAPQAKVYIKYPTTFADWIKQKKRSAGGYNQIRKMAGVEMRSFKTESLGAFLFFHYPKSLKQFVWLLELFFARVYLWFVIYRDINLKKKSQKEIWQRVESTK